jgi:aminoglycoside phosphotransferase (APT) family kinase protein
VWLASIAYQFGGRMRYACSVPRDNAVSSADAAAGPELPGLDLDVLGAYLDRERPGLVTGPLTGSLLSGGRSNLTYLVSDGSTEWVLRRPPLGHVLASAHDMGREYRIQKALDGSAVPVAHVEVHCADPEVLGAPFYLMERVVGEIYRNADQTSALTEGRRAALATELIDVLAELHAVRPAEVGLGDLGRPAGYPARQLKRWAGQLAQSLSRDVSGLERLHDLLVATLPADPAATDPAAASIVHGDYRLDNVVVGSDGAIKAVLDWEMATLGHPLADLGLLLTYWDGLSQIQENPIAGGTGPIAGFPDGTQLAQRYVERRAAAGVDVSLTDLQWFIGLGHYKLAVILEGIHYRYVQGQTVGEGFDEIGELVPPIVGWGLDVVAKLPPTS